MGGRIDSDWVSGWDWYQCLIDFITDWLVYGRFADEWYLKLVH